MTEAQEKKAAFNRVVELAGDGHNDEAKTLALKTIAKFPADPYYIEELAKKAIKGNQ